MLNLCWPSSHQEAFQIVKESTGFSDVESSARSHSPLRPRAWPRSPAPQFELGTRRDRNDRCHRQRQEPPVAGTVDCTDSPQATRTAAQATVRYVDVLCGTLLLCEFVGTNGWNAFSAFL